MASLLSLPSSHSSSLPILASISPVIFYSVLTRTFDSKCHIISTSSTPLFQDERTRSLDQLPRYASHASVLTKMYTEQILRRDELTIFEASLMPHQKAVSDLHRDICYEKLESVLTCIDANSLFNMISTREPVSTTPSLRRLL
jgi:hypothetical protein